MSAQCASIVPSSVVLPDFYRILRLAIKRLESTVESRLKVLGVSQDQYRVLSVLICNPKGCELCLMEQLSDVEHDKMMSLVASLQDLRILLREPIQHEDGSQCSILSLTPIIGVAMAEAAESIAEEVYRDVSGGCYREITRCISKIAGIFPESEKVQKPSNLLVFGDFGAFSVPNCQDTLPNVPR